MTDDRLLAMLAAQERLQREAYGMELLNFSVAERVAFIKNMVLATTDELHEALNEVSWKPWTSGEPTINEEAFFAELVDAWHFIMNLLLVARTDTTVEQIARELTFRYELKNRKNLRRQQEGYDGTDKCPGCRRALDDDAVRCRRVTVDDFDGDHRFWCSRDATFFHADGSRTPS